MRPVTPSEWSDVIVKSLLLNKLHFEYNEGTTPHDKVTINPAALAPSWSRDRMPKLTRCRDEKGNFSYCSAMSTSRIEIQWAMKESGSADSKEGTPPPLPQVMVKITKPAGGCTIWTDAIDIIREVNAVNDEIDYYDKQWILRYCALPSKLASLYM
jgi:hypothetical protein